MNSPRAFRQPPSPPFVRSDLFPVISEALGLTYEGAIAFIQEVHEIAGCGKLIEIHHGITQDGAHTPRAVAESIAKQRSMQSNRPQMPLASTQKMPQQEKPHSKLRAMIDQHRNSYIFRTTKAGQKLIVQWLLDLPFEQAMQAASEILGVPVDRQDFRERWRRTIKHRRAKQKENELKRQVFYSRGGRANTATFGSRQPARFVGSSSSKGLPQVTKKKLKKK